MRKRDLEKFRKILLEQRQEILEHLLKLENTSNSEISEIKGDASDIASIEISQMSLSKLGDRDSKLLAKIDYALAKIDDGSYGVCELTGEQIPQARLMARPTARYTVEAQEELERNEKRYRDPNDFEEQGLPSIDNFEEPE